MLFESSCSCKNQSPNPGHGFASESKATQRGFYPRTQKQSPGLFLPACGPSCCSNPAVHAKISRPTRDTGSHRNQKRPSGDSTRALKNSPPDCFCRPAGRRAVRIQLFMQKLTTQPGTRVGWSIFGDPAGIRTPDTLLKRQVLCRLSYWVISIFKLENKSGWGGRTRTSDCGSQSPVPYHLATPHYQGVNEREPEPLLRLSLEIWGG